ncbi:hypothetical protein NLM33_42225 [Bradyrhizobium sp. CCGUVB1N3]|uniref:hypothetical protein n=1 Tax=Bradyrhizobium sp. CCGUVB1N3 TaxID=2949629 RepID=UPI0020B36AC3|nr:hypothetical protein [Bradyrhizobium sp. CCGUVB1N3]MCP3476777.1 hypothetical protein [Bradyrhizobium sp. CCGUVB1N3]
MQIASISARYVLARYLALATEGLLLLPVVLTFILMAASGFALLFFTHALLTPVLFILRVLRACREMPL